MVLVRGGRADAIAAAILAALERRRGEIDRDPTLRRVSFTVKLRERGARPYEVEYHAMASLPAED